MNIRLKMLTEKLQLNVKIEDAVLVKFYETFTSHTHRWLNSINFSTSHKLFSLMELTPSYTKATHNLLIKDLSLV